MMHRGLVRIAVAAGAAMVGAVIAVAPAAATGPDVAPGVALLDIPAPPPLLTAKDFAANGVAKDCGAIKGGAKEGTDGWVFDQPAQGAANFAYILGLVDAKLQPVVLGLDNEGGIVNFKVDAALPNADSLKAGKIDDNQAKSLAKAAESTDKELAKAAGSTDVPAIVELPAGVAGGLTDKGGVWLQTPAGWHLVYGQMIHDKPGPGAPQKFHLVGLCAPKAAATPGATPAPTKVGGVAGGSGDSLPVTGTNVAILGGVGVLLVGVGALLFMMRRRRDTTKFVA
jgi:LPXTG-motif cell wall-anchored protein